jgi:hypothetical protein
MRLCKLAGLLCGLAMPAFLVPVFCEAAEIAPKVVWNHDRVDCDAEHGDPTCVIKAMRADGDNSAAIRLHRSSPPAMIRLGDRISRAGRIPFPHVYPSVPSEYQQFVLFGEWIA